MKITKLLTRLLLTCSLITPYFCLAQCPLKKVKSAQGTVTQTTENYWYKRDGINYNALSIVCLHLKAHDQPVYRLKIKYTSTDVSDVKGLKFLSADSASIMCPIILTGKQQIDNPAFNVRIYRVDLNADNLKFLTLHLLKSLIVIRSADNTETEIGVEDGAFLIQQLNCLQKLK